MESLVYGDIFEFFQKEYIFLAKTSEITYAAEILDHEKSKQLNGMVERTIAKNGNSDSKLYCFVMLTTEDFTKRCAWMGSTGKDDFSISYKQTTRTINEDDQKAIKTEILSSKAVPTELKKLVEANSI